MGTFPSGRTIEDRPRFDWRMFGALFITMAAQGLIQYGVIVTQVSDLQRRVDRLESKLDDKMLPRDEFEKRHLDLERRYEELRERLQQMEMRDRPRR